MCSQVLYIAIAYCMFKPVMFSIFSVCTLYLLPKFITQTGLPINMNYTYSDDATIAPLLHDHLRYFVGNYV